MNSLVETLAGGVAGAAVAGNTAPCDVNEMMKHGHYAVLAKAHEDHRTHTLVFVGIALCLISYFGFIELRQLRQSGFSYFYDTWNFIDMSSWALNFSFMSMFFLCVVLREEYFQREVILTIGSWGMFLMWIKVFYWFRLFSSYAYYVRLIMQTIFDSRKFMILVVIILISFGNFIYVADATNYGTTVRYAGTYFGIKPLDAVISVYDFGALGDINVPMYTSGFETISMMFMFLFATFMVSVVFMNMLIAIMSNTFSEVLASAESNGLRE